MIGVVHEHHQPHGIPPVRHQHPSGDHNHGHPETMSPQDGRFTWCPATLPSCGDIDCWKPEHQLPGPASRTERYRGMITIGSHGETDDALILFLPRVVHYPLAEAVKDDIEQYGHWLTVRYWTADRELPDSELEGAALRAVLGIGEARWNEHYSDITGYLWTDEDLMVGGHDLLAELSSQQGRYLLLEITYSRLEKPDGT